MTPFYLADDDIALMLGRSVNWLRKNRPILEADGFPKKDFLIGLTIRQDIEAWIARRRVVADAVVVDHHQHTTATTSIGETYEAF